MSAPARGFTLIELMVVIACAGIVTSAIGAFYLEVRIAGAMEEAKLQLQREAGLAGEWIARDLRDARGVETSSAGTVRIDREPGAVRYLIDEAGLSRQDDRERRLLARFVRGFKADEDGPGGRHVELELTRYLVFGREVRLRRSLYVRSRR